MKNNPIHRIANVLLAAILLAPLLAQASTEELAETSDIIIRKPALFNLGFERIKLSDNESMGMLGTSYLVEVIPGLHLGPAAYGAITGQRGGFFTAGGEAAWHHNLSSNLYLQTGVFAGGGGGSSASMVGGGLMIRPHLDLMWKLNGYRAGISASHVSFPNGEISSNQIGLLFSADSNFAYVTPGHAGQRINTKGRQGAGFDRVLATVGSYKPRNNVTNLSGTPATDSIGYVGARLERLFSPSLYWGVEAAGAASGNAAGYAEFLGTVGAESPLWNNALTIGARMALGMGGGGLVSVGGGLLNKLGAYATVNLGRDTHLSLEGGHATAPDGNFRATYGSVNFAWDLDHPAASDRVAVIVDNEWSFGTEHYFGAAHKDGSKHDLDAVTLKFNRYLNHSIYLTGQAHSAYSGNSGGYSVGLFGAGYRTQKFFHRFSAGAEMLLGAAGGGSLDTSGGAILQPMAYLGMDLTKVTNIKLSMGRVKSFQGALDSNVADLSVNFAFGTSSR